MKDLQTRFRETLATIKDRSGCWVWPKSLNHDGYGQIHEVISKRRNRGLRAHRVAYEVLVGPVPADKCVCHTCDNRACVNPAHLFLGDHSENMRDMAEKSRGSRKLTAAQVIEIRASPLTNTQAAKHYGVSDVTICHIRLRNTWKHLS